MVGIPGDAPQKGCPANSEFRTGYRDKSPQDTTRGLELRFLPIMYDFIPEFFAGYARSIVKKGAEGIPSGRREGQKAAPRKTVRNRLPEIPGWAAKNGRSGRSVPLRPLRYYSSPTVRRPTERPSLPHRRVLRATAGKRLHGCRELYRDNRRASVWRKRATEGSRKQPGITGAQARSTGSERG